MGKTISKGFLGQVKNLASKNAVWYIAENAEEEANNIFRDIATGESSSAFNKFKDLILDNKDPDFKEQFGIMLSTGIIQLMFGIGNVYQGNKISNKLKDEAMTLLRII